MSFHDELIKSIVDASASTPERVSKLVSSGNLSFDELTEVIVASLDLPVKKVQAIATQVSGQNINVPTFSTELLDALSLAQLKNLIGATQTKSTLKVLSALLAFAIDPTINNETFINNLPDIIPAGTRAQNLQSLMGVMSVVPTLIIAGNSAEFSSWLNAIIGTSAYAGAVADAQTIYQNGASGIVQTMIREYLIKQAPTQEIVTDVLSRHFPVVENNIVASLVSSDNKAAIRNVVLASLGMLGSSYSTSLNEVVVMIENLELVAPNYVDATIALKAFIDSMDPAYSTYLGL